MRPASLSGDSLALVLLCSQLGLPKRADASPAPLSPVEWHRLAETLAAHAWDSSQLLGRSADELVESLALERAFAERLAQLLDHGTHVAIELDRLADSGIWALTLADAGYPARLRERLGARAPVVLFGAGRVELLSTTALAIVGSRDLSQASQKLAVDLGERCARDGLTVVSGAARGADRLAMLAAMDAFGLAVGIVTDGLERAIRDPEFGRHIRDERLTLATQVGPAASFHVGNAMARNKLIYCLADAAAVIACSMQSGGTWAGAAENLRARWVPLYVMSGPEAPAANQDLVRLGATPLLPELLVGQHASVTALLEGATQEQEPADPAKAAIRQPKLF